MKTLVITGGTDGMGRALALAHLERGDNVVVVGRSAEKGHALLKAADELNAGSRATFIQADLSLLAENERVIAEIKQKFDVLDTLVLGARYFRSHRLLTDEGFEFNFALFYLGRYLLDEGLLDLLEKADRPVIVNLAGPGEGGPIIWDDLQLERDYHGGLALGLNGRLNDLLSVAFARKHTGCKTRYVLIHPGTVLTSFAGQYDESMTAHMDMLRQRAKPIAEALVPIMAAIDSPPAEPLSIIREGEPMSIDHPSFGIDDALRLEQITEKLLASRR